MWVVKCLCAVHAAGFSGGDTTAVALSDSTTDNLRYMTRCHYINGIESTPPSVNGISGFLKPLGWKIWSQKPSELGPRGSAIPRLVLTGLPVVALRLLGVHPSSLSSADRWSFSPFVPNNGTYLKCILSLDMRGVRRCLKQHRASCGTTVEW